MKNNITPEEKLLQLIKSGERTKPRLKNLKVLPLIPKYFNFIYAQKLLLGLLAISFIWLITVFLYPWVGLKKIKLPVVKEGGALEVKLEPGAERKSSEFYLPGLPKREIFASSLTPTMRPEEIPPLAQNLDLIKNINLVGIISGENPQAVIEDKNTQKTFYLSKGQFMGEFQVKEIKEGKVILDYKGQSYELYM
ncbi:MAG: hypothetical protein HZC16_01225 [Candidatus Omnitrophica bacterium]|nr:hypothetical protein [Candidatus Omnitrophota bacterium]